MPKIYVPSLFAAFLLIGFVTGLDLSPALAADLDPEGTSSTSVDTGSSSPSVAVRTRFQASNFQNRTMGLSGISYSIGLELYAVRSFVFYGELPFLWGDQRGVAVQETGNPKIGFEVAALESGDFSTWIRTYAALSQPSGRLASRFDTYRAGAEIRYRRGRYFSTMGGGQRFRVNENDSRVDVGDVTDFDFSLGFNWRQNWAFLALVEWYQASPVRVSGLTYARESQWAGLSPGVRFRAGGGLEILTALTFPVLQSRDQQEMEVAFWDTSFPRLHQVSLRTQMGVRF